MKKMQLKKILTMALAAIITVTTGSQVFAAPKKELVLASEVEWSYLNPARKDKAPMAGNLWGDRTKGGATGYLLKPKDGFQSPPHIHNVSYRAVVINGFLHNDDPDAEFMWMGQGSFWTQPKGQVHITAAKGETPIAYVEIEKGPYLVLPTKEAFLSQLRPVNVDTNNLVWLDASDVSWIDKSGETASDSDPQISFLWGDTKEAQLRGTMVKLPAGFKGEIKSHGTDFRAIVIKGQPRYEISATDKKILDRGSYFGSMDEPAVHQISSNDKGETILYIRSNGKFDIISG